MPIRLRLTLLSVVGALLLSIVGGLVFVHYFSGSLHRSGDVALRTTADAIVQDLSASPGQVDLNDSVPTGLLKQRQGVTQIIDPNGRVADASDGTGPASLLDA